MDIRCFLASFSGQEAEPSDLLQVICQIMQVDIVHIGCLWYSERKAIIRCQERIILWQGGII